MTYPMNREQATLSFGWERPTVTTIGTPIVSSTTIAGFTGLTANALAGQMLRILSGSQKSEIYWIIKNTTTVLTVQGNTTPNESGNTIGSGDRMAYSTNGIEPTLSTCNIYPGQVNSFTPPAREQEVDSRYVHGEGVTRLKGFVKKISYDGGSIPVIWQGKPELLLALGDFSLQGTDVGAGGGSTLSVSAVAWDNQVTLADSADYANGDYIQIGADDDDDTETRKVSGAPVGSVITLDHPLDHSHDAAASCNEVVAPWKTTVKPKTRLSRSFTLVRAITDPEGGQDPFIQRWNGCYINTLDFTADEDTELTSTLGVMAMNDEITVDGTKTAPSVTSDTTDFYHFDDSTVQWNSADFAIVKSFTSSWNWNREAVRCLGGYHGKRPYRIFRKYPTFDASYTYIPINKTLFDACRDSTERDGYVKFQRTASTDDIQINFSTGIGVSDPWDSPDEGHFESTFTASLGSIDIVINTDDTAPMY